MCTHPFINFLLSFSHHLVIRLVCEVWLSQIPPSSYAGRYRATVIRKKGRRSGCQLSCWALLPPHRCRRTISMETGFQNIQLCSTILNVTFPPQVIGPLFFFPLLYMIFQLAEGLLFIIVFRCYKKIKTPKGEYWIISLLSTATTLDLSYQEVPRRDLDQAALKVGSFPSILLYFCFSSQKQVVWFSLKGLRRWDHLSKEENLHC